MTCVNCGSENNRSFYDVHTHKWYCEKCPSKPERPISQLFSRMLLHVQGRHGGVGKRTTVHDNDISHRRVVNGEVIKDYGKKSFLSSNYYK